MIAAPITPAITPIEPEGLAERPSLRGGDAVSKNPERADVHAQLYRADIDGLRAVAVLSVIGFHAAGRWVSGGYVGVDVFLVISGFLISGILFKALENGQFSFRTFYARRIRRIFPALIVMLLAVWILGWPVLMANEYKQLGKDIIAGAGFFSNISFWQQSGYFTGAAETKPLLHLWSLGVEEQYYLLWPLVLFLVWKLGFKSRKFILLFLVVSFAVNVADVWVRPENAFYLPHSRFWEIMFGSALACVEFHHREEFDFELARLIPVVRWRAYLPDIKAWCGIGLIVSAVFLLDKHSFFPGFYALAPVAGTSLLISAGRTAWINRRLLSNRILVFVGLISYPLYLWHWPLLVLANFITAGNPSAALKLAAVALSFLLAWITFTFLERPIREAALAGSQRFMIPLLATGMLAVAVLGIFNIQKEGFPSRYPAALLPLMHYRADEHSSGWRSGECFLDYQTDWRTFDSGCVDAQPQDGPLIVLWGDSHAADLYPGLRDLQSTYNFRIAQYAAKACPPALDFEFKTALQRFCREDNDWILQKIRELRPAAVLLAAQWFQHFPDVEAKVSPTLTALKKSGIKNIILVGANPHWTDDLPRSMFVNYYRSFNYYRSLHSLPERMTFNLDPETFTEDKELREWAVTMNVTYLSPISLMCNGAGCLTRLQEDGKTDLTSFDQHHLTNLGSRYVARLLFVPLLARITTKDEFTCDHCEAAHPTSERSARPAHKTSRSFPSPSRCPTPATGPSCASSPAPS
jgi:peptidoglycan/LPS O-acetylase OafA/YrhL